MDSQTEHTLSRNRDLSQLLPSFFGIPNPNPNPNPVQNSSDPDQETGGSSIARDRIVLINPVTQGMVVIEAGGGSSSSSSLESLLQDLVSKDNGHPPASKSSILSLPSVEIGEGEESNECAICLEMWGLGGLAKEMPCKHIFHHKCIDKWLEIHGSCPVCRFKMPTQNGDDLNKKNPNRQRREIWVSFSFGSDRRTEETTQTQHIASNSAALDDEMET
ncbi:PREDICTED: E3 ubiquitin-protein ligase RING1-like [Ipomoea nil]|uniref:E3 ubiquitin-protein ligase RING1-like n=1 Tax=Ipomoea nil TaxID=35883 RepID=UPI00090107B5|nr:PREDICTED: E3 ubiquitin-protein ligase RING1-like [Ipomoea nil]